jgi:tRNA(Ile)-lysidine synthase
MLKKLENHIKINFSKIKGKKLLVCVSGGIDSMVLLHLLENLNYNLSVAHCNFKLRGSESDNDSIFIEKYCKSKKIKFFKKEFETNIPKYSVQMSARKLRYEWFYEIIESNKLDYIVTAHHIDDSLETFLINTFRSTGIDGLTGISSFNNKIIRPLLIFSKSDIINYSKLNNINWREDSSNKKNDYLRNKLRNQVIPLIKEINPSYIENFSKTVSHLKEDSLLIHELISIFKQDYFKHTKDCISINKSIVSNLSDSMIFKLFFEYGFRSSKEILDLCKSNSGKIIYSSKYSILSNRAELLIKKLEINQSEDYYYINSKDNNFPKNIEIIEGDFIKYDKKSLYLDKDQLKFPLKIRKWNKGDYIYPTAMNGKKLVSKIFKDKKLSLYDKATQWILEDNEHILWVIGIRFDKRKYMKANSNFKISLIEN